MKVVIAHRDGQARVVDLPQPPLGEWTVTIRVSHCAIRLPAELRFLDTVAERLGPKEDGLPLGSSVSGIVEEVGPRVKTLKPGLRVAAFGYPYVYHASHLSVPANLVVEMPKRVNHEEGAFVGEGARAVHLVRSLGGQLGETILIFGAGACGIIAAQAARANGYRPVLVDGSDQRLTKARNVGIPEAFQPGNEALSREIASMTAGEGADGAILTEEAGADEFACAARLVRERATMVVSGTGWGEGFPTSVVMEKELRIVAIRRVGAGHGDPSYEQSGSGYPRSLVRWSMRDEMGTFMTLLADRRVQVSPLVTERLPLERAPVIYEKIRRAQYAIMGAVLTV